MSSRGFFLLAVFLCAWALLEGGVRPGYNRPIAIVRPFAIMGPLA
ncbi:MAG TPA: hypothetical protein VNH11_21505 [Pirellulales bacterium]|nr:hypothetical protein [Pirellulales bacterium]